MLQVERGDIGVGGVFILAREGCVAHQQLEREDADCPQVHFLCVWLTVDQLWGDVVYCAAEGSALLVYGVG